MPRDLQIRPAKANQLSVNDACFVGRSYLLGSKGQLVLCHSGQKGMKWNASSLDWGQNIVKVKVRTIFDKLHNGAVRVNIEGSFYVGILCDTANFLNSSKQQDAGRVIGIEPYSLKVANFANQGGLLCSSAGIHSEFAATILNVCEVVHIIEHRNSA